MSTSTDARLLQCKPSGDYDGLKAILEQRVIEAPEDSRADVESQGCIILALAFWDGGLFEDAIGQAERLIELAVYPGEAHGILAYTYNLKGDLESAEKHARIALEYDLEAGSEETGVSREECFLQLAHILYEQGRYTESLALVDAMTEAEDFGRIPVLLLSARLNYRLGRFNEALNRYSECI